MATIPAASSSSTSGSTREVAPSSESWQWCTLLEMEIQDMVECGVLPEKQISGWKCCFGEDFPMEDWTEIVVFWPFYEKGFALPVGLSSAGFFTSTDWR